MTDVSIHAHGPVTATARSRGGANWITIVCGDVHVTIFAANDDKAADPSSKDPTLVQVAEAIAEPMWQLIYEEQAKKHDEDMSNGLSMAEYSSADPF